MASYLFGQTHERKRERERMNREKEGSNFNLRRRKTKGREVWRNKGIRRESTKLLEIKV
ncbi:unnamed protein product [Camellia sinensis]